MEASELEQAYIYFKHLLKTDQQSKSLIESYTTNEAINHLGKFINKSHWFDAFMIKADKNNTGINGTYETDSLRYLMLAFLIDYHGFNGFPKVMKDRQFKKLPETSYYHGFDNREYGRQFLDSFSYHYGSGTHHDGFYVTDIKFEAFKIVREKLMMQDESLDYSDISLKRQKDLTVEFKMPGAKTIRESQLLEIYRNFLDGNELSIEDENIRQKLTELRKFIEAHGGEAELNLFVDLITAEFNEPAFAVYLGYDMIVLGNDVLEIVFYPLFLNRSKLVVKQSDYDRFVSSGKGEESPEGGGLQ